MWLKDRILGPIPEQHFINSGINLRILGFDGKKTSLFWVRLGKSMGCRPISSLQGLEIGLELSI